MVTLLIFIIVVTREMDKMKLTRGERSAVYRLFWLSSIWCKETEVDRCNITSMWTSAAVRHPNTEECVQIRSTGGFCLVL